MDEKCEGTMDEKCEGTVDEKCEGTMEEKCEGTMGEKCEGSENEMGLAETSRQLYILTAAQRGVAAVPSRQLY